MSQKNSIYFLIVSVLVLLLAYNMKNGAYNDFIEKKEQLVIFEKEANEIGTLKKNFQEKKIQKRLLSSLEKISKPSKDYEKTNLRILEFDNLNAATLNQLLKKIENSTLVVKKLTIERISSTNAKVQLEIKK